MDRLDHGKEPRNLPGIRPEQIRITRGRPWAGPTAIPIPVYRPASWTSATLTWNVREGLLGSDGLFEWSVRVVWSGELIGWAGQVSW